MGRYYLVEERNNNGCLFAVIFLVIIVLAIVFFFLYGLLIALGIIAAVGVIVGTVIAVGNYVKGVIYAVKTLQSTRGYNASSNKLVSAFKTIGRFLGYSMKESWRLNIEAIKNCFAKSQAAKFLSFAKWMYLFACASIAICGTLCFIVTSLFLVTISYCILFTVIALICIICFIPMLVGIVIGLYYSTVNYFSSFNHCIKQLGIINSTQPAVKKYFWGKAYSDFLVTIKNAWKENRTSFRTFNLKSQGCRVFSYKKWINVFAALSVVGLGVLLIGVFSIIYGIILAILSTGYFILFVFVELVNIVSCVFISKTVRCTDTQCNYETKNPIYICECGAKHTELNPGRYGLIKRKCRCGRKIPCMYINGKRKIKTICPKCNSEMIVLNKANYYDVIVAGGTASGKTTLITLALNRLISELSRQRGWKMDFCTNQLTNSYRQMLDGLKAGRKMIRTTEHNKVNYRVKLETSQKNSVLSFIDIPGETFGAHEGIGDSFNVINPCGMVLIIDPMTVGNYANDNNITLYNYGSDYRHINDMCEEFTNNIDRVLKKAKKSKLSKLAIVITKCDATGLDALIGDNAINTYMQTHPDVHESDNARQVLCRDFLIKYGLSDFLKKLGRQFTSIKYFTHGMINYQIPNNEIHPSVKPFVWVLSGVDKNFKEWNK